MRIEELTWDEFEKLSKTVKTAVIPISPIEQHGKHLPIGSDFMRSQFLAEKINKKENIFLFPPIPIGMVNKGKYFPGTFTVRGSVITNLIYDICESFARAGIKRIIILTAHNSSKHKNCIEKGLRKFERKFKIDTYYIANSYGSLKVEGKVIETENDQHAGEAETSEFLYYNKKLVQMKKAKREFPDVKAIKKNKKQVRKYWKTGVFGDATKASLEKGKKLVYAQLKFLRKLINKEFLN